MVEVLVAISILLLATVGPMTIAARSLQYSQFTAQQNAAFFLAQEGIEAVFKIRAEAGLAHLDNPGSNDAWDWMSDGDWADCRGTDGCGIDWRDDTLSNNLVSCSTIANCALYFNSGNTRGRYTHQSSGDATPFTRVITIENISGTEALVRSTVSWAAAGSGDSRTVTLQTYLHDIYDTN
ncbi:hypothetical protein CL655_01120 [bacterium]|nr:hypothetical protein [bacterium]